MIATSLAREGRTYQLAHESRLLSISLLRGDQVEVAVMAARHGSAANKFDELNFGVQQWSDVPALRDCGAVMWCSLEQEHSVGDAVLCVGEVQWVTSGSRDAGPLLRFGGRYHAMGDLLEVADELPYPL
jgi:flavin reductase (DIM6/NTAB) family NADH-FMN oxidoreductase RutF